MLEHAQRRYEALPMRGIEHAPDDAKAWMVVEINTPDEDRFDRTPRIVCWSFQGRPEEHKADARQVAGALNNVAATTERSLR